MVVVFSTVLAAGFLAALTGCEWFQGSDPAQRSSPVISNLSIQPSSVLCAQEFLVSFHFEDPQGDITNAQVTILPTGVPEPKPAVREETPLWPETISRSSGTVSFTFSFAPKPCADQGGTWTITVKAEDERGHTSNTLTGQISLTTAG
jgi:hypothetical protein